MSARPLRRCSKAVETSSHFCLVREREGLAQAVPMRGKRRRQSARGVRPWNHLPHLDLEIEVAARWTWATNWSCAFSTVQRVVGTDTLMAPTGNPWSSDIAAA